MVTLNQRFGAFTQQGSVFRRKSGQQLDGKTNGAAMAITLLITKTGESAPDLSLCTYQEVSDGVIEALANDATNLNDADPEGLIANNINILYRDILRDDEVILCLGSGKGATINQLAVIDADNPGYVESMAGNNESIAAVPPFRILGRFMATYAAVSAKAQFAWVKGK